MAMNDVAVSLADWCNAWLGDETAIPSCAAIDDDLVLKVFGRTPLSGEYRGIEEINGVFLATLKSRIQGGSIKLVEVIGKGASIALVVKIALRGANGCLYNANQDCDVAVCDIKDGKIKEIRLYPDTKEIQTAIFGATYTLPLGGKP